MAVFLRKARNRSPEIDFSFCGELFFRDEEFDVETVFIEILPYSEKEIVFLPKF